MKFDLSWHKECLMNMRYTLADRLAEADRRAIATEQLRNDIYFYEKQIAEAEKRRISGFDRERLLVARRKLEPVANPQREEGRDASK